MRILFLILFLLVTACESEKSVKEELPISYGYDTSKLHLIRDLYELQQNLQKIYATDSITQLELDNNKTLIDSLIRRSLEYKDNKLDVQLLRNKFDKLSSRYKNQIDTLKKNNEFLVFQNIVSQEKLKQQKREYDKLNKMSSEMRDSLVKSTAISIENIKFEGIGSSLFDSDFVTYKSSKIKYIKFSASIPRNKKRESCRVIAEVYSHDSKNVISNEDIINYTGSEVSIILRIGKYQSFKKGKHTVRVLLNGKVVYESLLVIQ